MLIVGVFFVVDLLSVGNRRSRRLSRPSTAPVACGAEAHRSHPESPDGPEDLGLSPDVPITVTMTTSCS